MHVELRDIRKAFGSVQANGGISLSVDSGVVQGILGENGAGSGFGADGALHAEQVNAAAGGFRHHGAPRTVQPDAAARGFGPHGPLALSDLDLPSRGFRPCASGGAEKSISGPFPIWMWPQCSPRQTTLV